MQNLQNISPFLHPGTHARDSLLSILHLRRNDLQPVVLKSASTDETGYAEGAVVNTRFGSYPHSTLLDRPWGTQIPASKVDTGSRGRKGGRKRTQNDADLDRQSTPSCIAAKKLKVDDAGEVGSNRATAANDVQQDQSDGLPMPHRAPTQASSGFAHIVQPTSENWTCSLPHRTQVVYTPDYSFVLQKMRVRPGDVIIEAGAGSGSFTHAAARAVFNGYGMPQGKNRRRKGEVYSYEYHELRASQLQEELQSHGLRDIVTVTHRDVCSDGFILTRPYDDASDACSGTNPQPAASRVFLDLPAPWDALPHLTRGSEDRASPLSQDDAIHLCCFLPCIEQVQKLIASLRAHAWVEISMFELAQRRLETRRERVGLHLEGLRGVNASAFTVEESVSRLRELEQRSHEFRDTEASVHGKGHNDKGRLRETKQERLAKIAENEGDAQVFKEGNLIVRTEPEIKTHTSYLVFAVLPLGERYIGDSLIITESSNSHIKA